MNQAADRHLTQPIGIFDSGIGGLSVLKALRTELPNEHFICIADSGHAPYGERDDEYVIARSLAIAADLVTQNIKALVVACNTATAAAIDILRAHLPQAAHHRRRTRFKTRCGDQRHQIHRRAGYPQHAGQRPLCGSAGRA